MVDIPKTAVKLAVNLVKYQAEKQIGAGAVNTIVCTLTEFIGDTATEKITSFLDQGENARNLLVAFQDADKDFEEYFKKTGDTILCQMVHEKPLQNLESLNKLADALPKTLDSDGLLEVLRAQFANDWPNFTSEIHQRAAHQYRTCLEGALAVHCNQILPAVFMKMERIEGNTEKILDRLDTFSPKSAFTASPLFTIPPPPKSFTGRTGELKKILDGFKNGAFISGLSGGGGIGKTALARVLADHLAPEYPDARFEIDLQGASRSGQTPLAPVEAMRRLVQPFYPDQKLPDNEDDLCKLFIGTYRQRRVLLLLDNARDAAQIRPLLPPSPSAAIVTSRTYFSLADCGLIPLRLGVLKPEEARDLLRTSAVLQPIPDSELDPISNVCGQLPLALKIAAALLDERPDWTPAILYQKLKNERTRLSTLSQVSGNPDLDVEASLSLSYGVLSDEMKRRFRFLGIFPAPFDLSALAAIWNEPLEVCDQAVGHLLRLNLIDFEAGEIFPYHLHDLTRLYAEKLLNESLDDAQNVSYRHADFFLTQGGICEGLYRQGEKHVLESLHQFDILWPHLIAAYERFSLVAGQDYFADHWLGIFPSIITYLFSLRLSPFQQILIQESALAAARRLNDRPSEWIALNSLGSIYYFLDDANKAIEFSMQALAIVRKMGNRQGEGIALNILGMANRSLGNIKGAIKFHKQALVITQNINDRQGEGAVLGSLGLDYFSRRDIRNAIKYYELALAIDHEIGNRENEGNTLNNLGLAYFSRGEIHKSIEFYEQALAIACEIGDHGGEGNALGNLGKAYHFLGEDIRAIKLCKQSLIIFSEIGNRQREAYVLQLLGFAYATLNDYQAALANFNNAIELVSNDSCSTYNVARIYALQNKVQLACSWLEKVIQMSPRYVDMARNDEAFNLIRDTPEFQAILKEFE